MSESIGQLQTLYREHGPALLRYLRRMTGRSDSAEDLLQETFVQALRGWDRSGELRSPRAWLFTIARHLGLNAVHRRRRMAPIPEDVADRPAEPDHPLRDRMRAAIERLPEKQKEALKLRLQDDLSYEEVAAVLGVPVGTVRSRLHHAIRSLRASLSEE